MPETPELVMPELGCAAETFPSLITQLSVTQLRGESV